MTEETILYGARERTRFTSAPRAVSFSSRGLAVGEQYSYGGLHRYLQVVSYVYKA